MEITFHLPAQFMSNAGNAMLTNFRHFYEINFIKNQLKSYQFNLNFDSFTFIVMMDQIQKSLIKL
jgi:hypothetical protein